MKKIGDLIRPYASVVFGALLLLFFLGWLNFNNTYGIVVGVIAIVFAAFYIITGLITTFTGDLLTGNAKKIVGLITITLFPLFIFVYYLLTVIRGANVLNVTGWVIVILSMIGSLAFATLYPVSVFANNALLKRLSQLFAAIFALVLLLNVLFDINVLDENTFMGGNAGDPNIIGMLNLLLIVLYGIYLFMLFSSLGKEEVKQISNESDDIEELDYTEEQADFEEENQ